MTPKFLTEKIPPVLGIPVVLDYTFRRVAEARGVGPFKRIVVGATWRRLPMDERIAVLYHEAAHCRRRHMEKRLLALPLALFPAGRAWLGRFTRAQETEADAFAAAHGYADAMSRFIRRFTERESIFYPSHTERLQSLEGAKPC